MTTMSEYWIDLRSFGHLDVSADERLTLQTHAFYGIHAAETGLPFADPPEYLLMRTRAQLAMADHLESEQQRRDGCQAITRKGTRCKQRVWPYCHGHLVMYVDGRLVNGRVS